MPRLFAPGPVDVPERVRRALAEPLCHHRTPEFTEIFADIRAQLRRLWHLPSDWEPLVLSCSGTGAMEGLVASFMSRGAKALVISSGKFGERFSEILNAYGCQVIELRKEWGQDVQVEEVLSLVKAHPDLRAVYMLSADTSTGIQHELSVLGPAIREHTDALLVADCICDFGGASDCDPAAWQVDVAISAGHKCLMIPPGIGIAVVSERAWTFHQTSDLPKYYLDWKRELDFHRKDGNASTSSVNLLRGLHESMTMIEEQGLPNVLQRYARLASGCRAAIEALGLQLLPEVATNAVTVVKGPASMDCTAFIDHLAKSYGFRIANGQGHLKGKLFRIGHMGMQSEGPLLGLLNALESALVDVRVVDRHRGAAVAAAAAIFAKS